MFLNLKYHIVSLVAVFLALGLGILIGSAFPGDTTLDSQQQQIMEKLESRIESVRQKNELMRARVNQLEIDKNMKVQFEKQIAPLLVEGKLTGRRVAIIATAGRAITEDLAWSLRMAGASVPSSTYIEGDLLKNRVLLLEKLGWPDMDDKALLSKIAGEVSSAVLSGDSGGIRTLAAVGVLRLSGKYGEAVTDVVIMGGDVKTQNSIDSHIIDYFKIRGICVYGVEESHAVYSCMREYQKKGLATVDNIDTVPGQVSLVYAMSGMPGHYGIKSTAKSLLPVFNNGVEANAM